MSAGAQAVVCLSTDKAAYPINAMGASKALMEKTAAAKAGTLLPLQTKSAAPGAAMCWGPEAVWFPCFSGKSRPEGP